MFTCCLFDSCVGYLEPPQACAAGTENPNSGSTSSSACVACTGDTYTANPGTDHCVVIINLLLLHHEFKKNSSWPDPKKTQKSILSYFGSIPTNRREDFCYV